MVSSSSFQPVLIKCPKVLRLLACAHLVILASSNYLVQFPFMFLGLHTTWGTFMLPFSFLVTDLTVRLYGGRFARRVILTVMLPALLLSYIMSVLFSSGQFQGASALLVYENFFGRIALASFTAFVVGQVLDVLVFSRLRQLKQWWVAPAASTLLGNTFDTLLFFSVAFYQSQDAFMAANWWDIALFDGAIKLLMSIAVFLPIYGMVLSCLMSWLREQYQAEKVRMGNTD